MAENWQLPARMTMRVSLAELAGADIHLHPAEAVAIVAALCRRQILGELRGVPSPGIIRLSRDGDVIVEGPITTGDAGIVARMAQLLSDILPGFEAAPQLRARGGLRLAIGRALGSLDLPPYESLDDFCTALDRFAAPDLQACVRGLFQAWEDHTRNGRAPRGPLTISDVRRARRATGLTLEDIASVADVPAADLRSLEWGDLRGWPRTPAGRDRIARYARAAGLDEELVLSVAWPVVEKTSAVVDAGTIGVAALVPAATQALATWPPPPARVDYRFWLGWIVAAVALVMLAVSTFALIRERALQTAPPPIAPVRATQEAVVPLPEAQPAEAVRPPDSQRRSSAVDRPARATATATGTPTRAKRATPPRRPPPPKKSLLNRELFRIVFR